MACPLFQVPARRRRVDVGVGCAWHRGNLASGMRCACRRHLRCPLQRRGPRHVPLKGRLAGKLHHWDVFAEGRSDGFFGCRATTAGFWRRPVLLLDLDRAMRAGSGQSKQQEATKESMSDRRSELTVSLWRGAQQGRYETYKVPWRENQTVLDVVTFVQRH